jgi:hypothetical protein
MSLVDDQTPIGRQHGGIRPVLRGAAHREIRQQQMMVHDDHIRLGGGAARLEDETLLEVRALHARAVVRLGGDFVPHLGARRRRQVGQRAVTRALGPGDERLHLARHAVIEQLRRAARGLLEPRHADVVAPPFEQREANLLIAQRLRQKGEILADELFLEVDRVGGHDGALTIRRRPAQRGHQVAERFADAGAGFQQADAAVVVESRDRRRHVALARTVLVTAMLAGDRSLGAEVVRDGLRIEPRLLVSARHLHHYIERARVVVDDAEADAVVVHPRRDVVVRP